MFELPESLGELSVAELTDLLAAARAEATSLTALLSDVATEGEVDLDRLEMLADAIESLNTAIDAVEVEDTARADRAAALAARLHVEPVADSDLEDETDEVEVVEPIVAATKPKRVVKAPVLDLPKKSNSSLVASSNLSGVSTGHTFESTLDLVPHMIRAWDSVKGASNGTKVNVFEVHSTTDPKLVANGRNDQEVVSHAVKLAQGTVEEGRIAAGGWCAPAEQRYEICNLATIGGLLTLPHISVPRGSISYFRDLRYSDVEALALTGIGDFTNAELEALPPVVKPCVEVPCLDPVTFTLDAVSFCVRAGVLQRRAFPELVEAWLKSALIVHQRYLNARRIAAVVALASANTVVIPGSFGALAAFLNALDLQATDLRFDHAMDPNATVEGFAPFWLPLVFRADMDKRQNDVDWNFTQAQLASLLAARNIRLQFVKDYVDAPFAGLAPVTALPTSVNVVLYPAGAYLDASDDILRVGAIQDSTLLTTNREQLVFIETAEGVLPACGDGRVVTIPLCASGETAGAVDPIGVNTCG